MMSQIFKSAPVKILLISLLVLQLFAMHCFAEVASPVIVANQESSGEKVTAVVISTQESSGEEAIKEENNNIDAKKSPTLYSATESKLRQNIMELMIITKIAKVMPYLEFRSSFRYPEDVKDWYISKNKEKISEIKFLRTIGQVDKANHIESKIIGKRLINTLGGSLLLVGGILFWLVRDNNVTQTAVSMIFTGVTLGFIGDFFSYLPSEHFLSLEETAYRINLYNAKLKEDLDIKQVK